MGRQTSKRQQGLKWMRAHSRIAEKEEEEEEEASAVMPVFPPDCSQIQRLQRAVVAQHSSHQVPRLQPRQYQAQPIGLLLVDLD